MSAVEIVICTVFGIVFAAFIGGRGGMALDYGH